MNIDTWLSPHPDIVFSKVEDEIILMSMQNGSFFVLDGPSAAIWDCLTERCRFRDLIDQLLAVFEVDRATCEADCIPLLTDMIEKKLVVQG